LFRIFRAISSDDVYTTRLFLFWLARGLARIPRAVLAARTAGAKFDYSCCIHMTEYNETKNISERLNARLAMLGHALPEVGMLPSDLGQARPKPDTFAGIEPLLEHGIVLL